MLYWIWFGVLTLAGCILAYLFARGVLKDDDGDNSGAAAGSVAFMVFSLISSWPVLVGEFYDYLDAVLPNAGEAIHCLTAVIIILFACILWVASPAVICSYLFSPRESTDNSQETKGSVSLG